MKAIAEKKKDRIKRVFPNIQGFVHLWAHQSQDRANCRNAYFEGDTVYSYGRHFPIARIYIHPKTKEKTVFFTNRTYSSTTSGHVSAVSSACSHMDKLYMENVIIGEPTKRDHEGNLNVWKHELEGLFGKLEKARKKEIYIDKIQGVVREMNKYIQFFDLKIDKHLKALTEDAKPENFEAYLKSESSRIKRDNKKAKIARVKAEEKRKEEYMEQVAEWRTFERSRIYGRYNEDYLRYNIGKKRIETSQAVEVPVEVARKFYNHIKTVLHNGSCVTTDTCLYKIVEYEVREITREHIIIGCHRILMSEVEAMAKQLGWKE